MSTKSTCQTPEQAATATRAERMGRSFRSAPFGANRLCHAQYTLRAKSELAALPPSHLRGPLTRLKVNDAAELHSKHRLV